MRVCFVTPEYVTEDANYDGGLSNYLHRIALSLKLAGHSPVIVVASNRNETIESDGIMVRRVNVVVNCGRYMKFLRYFPGLEWEIMSRQLNAAVRKVHAACPLDIVQYASVGATALYRPKDIPGVVRVSGNQKLWDDAYGEKDTKARQKYQALEIKALQVADAIFGPSHFIADYLHDQHNLKVEVIESPFVQDVVELDPDLYERIKHQLRGKDYFLFFGSLGLAKGVKEIADAIQAILGRFPDVGMVFVGKDLGLEGRPIMDYVKAKAGIYADRIIWQDRVRHHLLYPVIQNAKLVLLPSRVDNFPNCCVEAMAFGKVVIGTRGTSFEQLLEGGNGVLCQPRNPDDLFRAIVQTMDDDPALLAEIGGRALERISSLSPTVVTRTLIDFYSRVLSEEKSRQ